MTADKKKGLWRLYGRWSVVSLLVSVRRFGSAMGYGAIVGLGWDTWLARYCTMALP
jgi:hypothetical protein